MIVTIEAFFRKLLRVFSPDKWLARFLNLPGANAPAAEPGLVMVQIDGLGSTQFERAMKAGHLPFLARLIKKEGYVNRRHYSGLPSNTPAVQGLLFYGVKACVPAFGFKDSLSGKVLNMFSPESAALVEARLKQTGEGLLKDGSTYGNIFTGSAKEAHFCVSAVGWGSLLTAANPLAGPLTALLHLHVFIRALFLMCVELVLAAADCVHGAFSGKKLMKELGFIPLRVAVCVVLREAISLGARIDITRGLPVIHLNLAGYDEQAHHRGPTSAFAHWSLRGIDSVIAKVWKAAQRCAHRHYEVFIYSDHGQEDTVNYSDATGRSVEEAVEHVLNENDRSGQRRSRPNEELRAWRARLLWNKPERRSNTQDPGTTGAAGHAIVTAVGPVGHIYLSKESSPDDRMKIASQLVTSGNIPIVMVSRGQGQAFAWTAKGKFILPEQADKVIDVDHPFMKEVARDLVDLCDHPDAGDLVILGWRKGPRSLSFHSEQGSHAGPGPEETSGFALLPMGAMPAAQMTVNTQDLRDASLCAMGHGRPMPGAPLAGADCFRVMTYNVHSCMGRDGKISPKRIARIIARQGPDIIALQELEANDQAHQAQIISESLSMAFHYHPTLFVKKGRRGNAIISKFPMRLIKSANLPRLPRAPFLEPRAALWVEMDVGGKKVQIINTHLSLSRREGLLQAKALCGPDWLGNPACKGPVVFCGDLNALTRSKICKELGRTLKNVPVDLKNGRPLKTLPSFFPLGLVDHIFVGPGLITTQSRVPATQMEKMSSDHLPLIVDVQGQA